MNRKINRRMTYTPEFRAEAVVRVMHGEHVPTVAKELGINPSTLYNWKAKGLDAPKPKTNGADTAFRELAEEEASRLSAEIVKLRDEYTALQRYLES